CAIPRRSGEGHRSGPEFCHRAYAPGECCPEYSHFNPRRSRQRRGTEEAGRGAPRLHEDLRSSNGNRVGTRRPRGRSAQRRPADRDHCRVDRHLGARGHSRNPSRPYWPRRYAARSAPGWHHHLRKSLLQERRGRLRHATRREPAQARHQNHRAQGAPRQSQGRLCSRHDRRSAGGPGSTQGQPAPGCFRGAASMIAKANGKPAGSGCEGPDKQGQNAIDVEHIVKKYGDFTAVNDVTFHVVEEEIFGLLGPNGAGKSTLIRMMTTRLPITSGRAIVAGHDVSKDADGARRCIGVIPQALTSDLDLTVEENMNIYAKLYDVPAKQRKEAIDELLVLVDLTKWRDAQTKTLSGGMRRRLEIARGLVHSPRIFFLDEPTTGLDPVSRVAVWEMLTNIKKNRQLTILITTHYMDEADRLCDRIAIVDHGKLVALDTPPALKASVPGSNVIEAQFDNAPASWEQSLHGLSGVTSVQHQGAGMYRILTGDGSRTTTELVEAAVRARVVVKSLSVQNTSLDDVFVHYTGRQLRDELIKAHSFVMPPRPGMQP